MSVIVPVALGERSYDVVIDDGEPEACAPRLRALADRAVIVTDAHVEPLWGGRLAAGLASAGCRADTLVMPAGESAKTLATFEDLAERMVALGIDRRTLVIALGGGVVGDVAGFLAASLLRGLPFAQVPTTVLAMVDSSVGGKTAVNLRAGKNLVGAFHQPSLVWAPLAALATLPRREVAAGLAEVVKAALIADPELLAALERDAGALAAGDPAALAPVIARSVAIKATIVARDERETGDRVLLNVGHTVGHGFEAAAGYGALLHGEAVALGTLAELRWAARRGLLVEPTLPSRAEALFARLGLPVVAPALDADAIVSAIRLDKKASGGTIRVPLVTAPGRTAVVPVPLDSLREMLVP